MVSRARLLASALVSALIATLTLTGSIPPAQAANGTMSGTVTEAGTGTPIAGATVELFCWVVVGSDPGDLCAGTQTAANGTWSISLPPGVYKVSFDDYPEHERQFYGGGRNVGDDDSAEVTVPSGGSVTGISAALEPLRTVSGTVTGDGGPLGGINATAYQLSDDPSPAWESVDVVVTDPDGTYQLHLADGTYRVGFSDAQGPFQTVFYDGAPTLELADDVIVAGANVSGIDADMALNYAIRGKVTVDGIDMPGVTVTAFVADASQPTGWRAVKVTGTGPDGSYALFVPDGTYRVEFRTFQARFDTVYYPGVDNLDDAADVVVAGADVLEINATITSGEVETGPAITGTVTLAADGSPLAGILVTAWRFNVAANDWIQVRQKVTGPDGTYALFVPEGTYRIEFVHSFQQYQSVFYGGAQTVEDATDVVQDSDGVAGIDIQLVENNSISGTITADPLPDSPTGPPPTQVVAYEFDEETLEWVFASVAFNMPDGSYTLYADDGTYRIGFEVLSDGYRRPHFYDGVDNIGEATDVVLAGTDVTGIDAHLIASSTEPPPTWSSPRTLSAAGRDGWGPQVAVGPNGAAVAVWFERDDGLSRVKSSIRRVGRPWSSPKRLSPATGDAFDPQISVGADGRFVAVWRQWDGSHHRVRASTRTTEGWSAPVDLSSARSDAWAPQVASGGTTLAVWRQDGALSLIKASRLRANGTWSVPSTLSDAGASAWDPQVAVAANGIAIAAWSRWDGLSFRVQAALRPKQGPWGSPFTLSAAGADAENPQVSITDAAVAVVWRRWDGESERVQAVSRQSGQPWSGPTTLSAAGRDAHDPQVAVDPTGRVTAVWARWDGSSDRVQAASRAPSGSWSTPKTLSPGGAHATVPQVAAGPDGKTTAVWHQSEGFGQNAYAAIRTPGQPWSTPTRLTDFGGLVYGPQVATGLNGTVAAVWEIRIGADDRVQGVVRFDPGGTNHCLNSFGVDLNFLFGVPEQFVHGQCKTVDAKSKWRPLEFWSMNTVFETVPPGFVPAAATPLEDLLAKLEAIKIVIDRGTPDKKSFTFSPGVLHTDRTLDEYDPDAPAWPIAAVLPKLPPLPVGEHTVRVFWILRAQHCDGLGDVEAQNCLPSGSTSFGHQIFTVGSQ